VEDEMTLGKNRILGGGLVKSAVTAILMSSAIVAMAQDGKQVAYLSASSANTWLSVSVAQMQKVAEANGITITEFDAQFDPARQTAQMQDAIESGKYDGIILVSINGPGAIPDIEAALAEGIEVVILNQVVVTDLTTSDPQFEGLAASVLAAPHRSGQRQGQMTVRACEGVDPCEVVFIYGIKGIPLDDALRAGFDEVIAEHAHISVVAEGEGKYLGPDGGIAATQDIQQVKGDFDVMIGADQSMQGAAIVLADEGMTGDVKLIGLGA
jgi:ribose transport system substrate-binding protein